MGTKLHCLMTLECVDFQIICKITHLKMKKYFLRIFVACRTHKIHLIKCSTNTNDFTVFDNLHSSLEQLQHYKFSNSKQSMHFITLFISRITIQSLQE